MGKEQDQAREAKREAALNQLAEVIAEVAARELIEEELARQKAALENAEAEGGNEPGAVSQLQGRE